MPTRVFEFTELRDAPIIVDAVYRGGDKRTSSGGDPVLNDPLGPLLGVKNQGGIRPRRRAGAIGTPYVVLTLTGDEVDWPDAFDPTTGHVTYFGDNRSPGHLLLEKQGNKTLDDAYRSLHTSDRLRVPVFLVFRRTGRGRDFTFLGAAAPGYPGLGPSEDLVPRWYSHPDGRFQNYEAHLTVMDLPEVPRGWLEELLAGIRTGSFCPTVWRDWALSGRYAPLITTPVEGRLRTKKEQLPEPGTEDMAILSCVHNHFKDDAFAFERLAGELFRFHKPGLVGVLDYTRPYRDGGRDAVGEVVAGVGEPVVIGEFALEAKCYEPGSGCGVHETARLLARLRYRMFGVFVTTSYVDRQAYVEARLEDRHPVVFICGRDIVQILRQRHLTSLARVKEWLAREFPLPAP